MKLINLLLPLWLLCVVDSMEDNLALIEVPQGKDFAYIHVETEGSGCDIKEGSRILVRYESEESFSVKCQKVLDFSPNL